MCMKEYLKFRESKTFTLKQVETLLDKCGYRHKPMDTLVAEGKTTWKESGYKSEEVAQAEICKTNKGEVPYHFAYIKFYNEKGKGPYALVAGKTNLGAPDFSFVIKEVDVKSGDEKLFFAEMGKDKAKAFLGEEKKERSWYCQMVLAVWPKDQKEFGEPDEENKRGMENLAFSVEADISGLFGLYFS